ncbi:hypothetical protein Lal_00043320 [Lupinus albus]|nr:hypothetical protein Lal_00043320 [Lupinus albus]
MERGKFSAFLAMDLDLDWRKFFNFSGNETNGRPKTRRILMKWMKFNHIKLRNVDVVEHKAIT